MNKKYLALLIIIIGLIAIWLSYGNKKAEIKIGLVTDLSGPVAYYGESTKDGAEYAIKVLKDRGININLIVEDYQTDPAQAANATQKLVYIDKVNAMYVDFNPGAISANSILKKTNLPFIYAAAIESPLKDNPNAYKTYLDYRSGCEMIANEFKSKGIQKVGMLRLNLEFADLCLEGLQKVYGKDISVESYNLGDDDVRTQINKLEAENIQGIVNVGFESDTFNALKVLTETKSNLLFGTVGDTVTDKVKENYKSYMPKIVSFGFASTLDKDLIREIESSSGKDHLSSEYAATIAYTHIIQLGEALNICANDMACLKKEIEKPVEKNSLGFERFINQVGKLNQALERYK
ncbi:MAG: ABC-type branched-chain amino acid transport system, periplasmic component, branched-chain amino [Candidatus Nomurabacteria bacterium]|nr:ABC-type branched-chain amino acid transport system, periplasmic component, branched-chain amino [Candidatus Nomurabacteria bacterium]